MANVTVVRTASSSQIGSLLTQASASTTYLTQVSASNTYLTQASASNTYASKTSPEFNEDISIQGSVPDLTFINSSGSVVSRMNVLAAGVLGEAEFNIVANEANPYKTSRIILYGSGAQIAVNTGELYSSVLTIDSNYPFSLISSEIGTMLNVDSSGRVTSPKQPAFNVTYTDGSVTFGAGVVVFNTVRTNVGGHYSTSTGRFTAPVAGHYHFDVHFFKYTAYTNPSNTYWGFRVNGGATITTNHGAQGSDGGQSLSTTIYLNANDYIDVYAQNTIQSWGGQFLQFSGYLAG